MLQSHVENSIADIQALLAITKEDIRDIRESKHEAVFSRMKSKEELIEAFNYKREQAKQIIQELSAQQPDVEIRELVGKEVVSLFDELNEHLLELKQENLHFAKLSIAMGEFYRSLLDNLIPSEAGYHGRRSSSDVKFIAVDA